MKTCIKRFLCLLMALCLMGQWLPAPAQAVPGDSLAMQTDRISHEEITEINPLYANVITEEDLIQPSGRETAAPSAVAESEYDTTEEELVALIRQALLQRQTEFVFYYTTEAVDSSEEFDTTYVKALFRKAMEHTGEPTEGDCLRWGYGGYRTDISYYVSNGLSYVTATPTVTYYTTAAQEAELDIAVEELLSTVDRTASDYEQIKTVYDYICANITYDHEHLKDNSYTLKYTAYAALINGTAVCQGYAVLLYRLALELGIDARLIGGIGNNGSHGWNIVKLNDVYYNLDSTWDAIRMQQVGYYQYFLQCEETFTEGGTDHFRYEEYDTPEFHAAYPMSKTDYDPNAIPEEPDFIAEGVCGDNLTWVLDNEGVLTISGEGEMWDFENGTQPWADYREQLASVVIDEGVTSIGDYAFLFHTPASLELPEGVTEIGAYAFAYCSNLTGVVLPESLTTIGDYAFFFSGITEITIPANVETIGLQALCCPNMTAIHVAEGNANYYSWNNMLYHVGHLAQVPCAMEGELVLPELTLSIYDYALFVCSRLTSVEIPAYATEIGTKAFAGCDSLTEIHFRGDPPAIGDLAFDGITATVTYPGANGYWTEDVMQNYGGSIEWEPFDWSLVAYGFCGENNLRDDDLYRSSIAGENATWALTDNGTMTIYGEGRMMDCGFHGNHPWRPISSRDANRLTKVVVDEGITYLGRFSFLDIFGECITELVLPSTLTEFGQGACYLMASLESVNIPEGVTELPGHVFSGCPALTSLDIPASVAVIGESALYNCASLTEIRFCGDAPAIASNAFSGVTATAYYPANNPTWTEDVMQDYGGTITWVVYDPNVVAEGTCGENVTWTLDKDGVLTISGTGDMDSYSSAVHQPWYDLADAITSIRVEGTVNKIGAYSFYGLNNLDSVVIEEGVTSISGHALKYCSSLCSVILPESLTDFGPSVFYGSDLLTSAGPIGGDTHIQFAWTEAIPDGAFNEMFHLSYVVLPGALKSIGAEAFRSCAELTGIDLPDGLETIGAQAFESSGLTKISFPDSVTAIGSEAFEYCPLTEVRLPAALKVISANVFHDCEELLRVTIPDSVEEIELRAFWSCDGLETVIFEGNAPQIQERAFENTTTTAYYPANNPTWTEDVMQDYGGDITWEPYYVSGLDALTVGDVNALEQNNGNGWEFDPATDTLYLWGGSYDGDADAAIYAEGDLTIVLEEDTGNGFYGVNNGVLVLGNLTITGPGHLLAKASAEYGKGGQYGPCGIFATGNLTIVDTNVTAETDMVGIGCNGSLEIIRSSVNAFGARNGIHTAGDIRISASTVESHATSIQADNKWDFRGDFLMGLVCLQGNLTIENNSQVTVSSDQFGVMTQEIHVEDSTLTSTATLMAVYAETLISITGESNIHAIATLTPEQYEQYGEQAYAIRSDGQIEIGEGLTFEGEIGNESGQTWQTILGSDGIPAREVHIVPVTKIASGWSGTTTWVLTDDGVMTFSGSGNMKNYGFGRNQPWLDYADQITSIVVEEGVTAIGTGAFMDLTRLESVTLPETGLTKIGEAAFYSCTSLKEIYIPDGIYTIWEYTFKNCTSLESVRLPRTLEKIDQGAFENCTGLETMFLPGNVNIIGAWSFKACSALTEIDMQWTDATEIRAGAFKNCSALTEINLPANIQKLGDSCFYGIGATSFTVPITVTVIEPWCFARAALKEIIFEGNAPTIGEGAFNKITLTAYYPGGNTTWTADNMLNYGGTVTWKTDET